MGRHNVHPGNWQISGIAKRGGSKLPPYCIVLVLIEHECMGPNWTHAEGFILGVGAKMFTIAGPVIVYGVSASVVYGLIYWITTLF